MVVGLWVLGLALRQAQDERRGLVAGVGHALTQSSPANGRRGESDGSGTGVGCAWEREGAI